MLDTTAYLGGQKVEGVVVKNYNRFMIDGNPIFGKYVREEFKELNGVNWHQENPTAGDIVQQIIAEVKTDVRWEKAVQHLRDKGKLDASPKDIGALIKEVQRDVEEECREYIMGRLYSHFSRQIIRASTSGIPEWYKGKLAKAAFEK